MLLIILPRYTATNFTLSFITPPDWQKVLPFVHQTQTTYLQVILRVLRYPGLQARVQGLASDSFLPRINTKSKKRGVKVACHFNAYIVS